MRLASLPPPAFPFCFSLPVSFVLGAEKKREREREAKRVIRAIRAFCRRVDSEASCGVCIESHALVWSQEYESRGCR